VPFAEEARALQVEPPRDPRKRLMRECLFDLRQERERLVGSQVPRLQLEL
jgi:hypothetical protein